MTELDKTTVVRKLRGFFCNLREIYVEMDPVAAFFTFLWITQCSAEEYYYIPYNVTRSTLSRIAAYRSALTLDWLVAEDNRQRDLAAAFQTNAAPPSNIMSSECMSYARPASGKVARLMLELLKNLEGDEAKLVPELIQVLIKSKILVETSILDEEPGLQALVETPAVMMGEPHVTFPRIIAMVWMTATDPSTTKKYGWCSVKKVNKYISTNKPPVIAKRMRALDIIVSRARFIIEEFIQNITPLNLLRKKSMKETKTPKMAPRRAGNTVKRPIRFYSSDNLLLEDATITTTEALLDPISRFIEGNASGSSNSFHICNVLLIASIFIIQLAFISY